MTDEQLHRLADLIAQKLIDYREAKDVAWHDKSPVTIEDLLDDMPLSFKETEEEHTHPSLLLLIDGILPASPRVFFLRCAQSCRHV